MRISRVAHVAERYFSRATPRKILIPTIADITEPFFSRARTRKMWFSMVTYIDEACFSRNDIPKAQNLRTFGGPTQRRALYNEHYLDLAEPCLGWPETCLAGHNEEPPVRAQIGFGQAQIGVPKLQKKQCFHRRKSPGTEKSTIFTQKRPEP